MPQGILFSKLFISLYYLLNLVFLATSLLTASFNFFKSIGTVFSLSAFKSSAFVFKLFKPVGILTNLLRSSLSSSVFKAIKSLAARSDVSTPVAGSNSF